MKRAVKKKCFKRIVTVMCCAMLAFIAVPTDVSAGTKTVTGTISSVSYINEGSTAAFDYASANGITGFDLMSAASVRSAVKNYNYKLVIPTTSSGNVNTSSLSTSFDMNLRWVNVCV